MATMYELTGEYRELLAMAGDPEIDPEAIADTLEAISGEIEVKAENENGRPREVQNNFVFV